MGKGKGATSTKVAKADNSHKVAIISAAGLVAAAAVTGLFTMLSNDAENADAGRDPSPPASASTSPSQPPSGEQSSIDLEVIVDAPLKPPPRIVYTFEGTASGLDRDDGVFVSGEVAPGDRGVSPMASFGADGRWRIDWTLDKPAVSPFFDAFIAEHVNIQSYNNNVMDPGKLLASSLIDDIGAAGVAGATTGIKAQDRELLLD